MADAFVLETAADIGKFSIARLRPPSEKPLFMG